MSCLTNLIQKQFMKNIVMKMKWNTGKVVIENIDEEKRPKN